MGSTNYAPRHNPRITGIVWEQRSPNGAFLVRCYLRRRDDARQRRMRRLSHGVACAYDANSAAYHSVRSFQPLRQNPPQICTLCSSDFTDACGASTGVPATVDRSFRCTCGSSATWTRSGSRERRSQPPPYGAAPSIQISVPGAAGHRDCSIPR